MKMQEYRYTVWTFRRTVTLFIWGTEKDFNKLFEWTWFDYNFTAWMYYFDKKHNCNIIWLKEFDLNTLVHELVHCTIEILDQVWIEDANWEPAAFIYEELFTKIWIELWDSFELEEDTKDFYSK